jgi:hypothetical protein
VLAYHQTIRDAADRVPALIGQWYGTDVQVPVVAVKTLKPTVMISRRYQNVETSAAVNLLFVHSRDAMDMMFHYPPVCYKFSGWTPLSSEHRVWRLAGRDVELMEYSFRRDEPTFSRSITICNFMVLPTGMGLDMDDVRDVAHAPSHRVFGSGQMQVTFDADSTEAERRAVLDAFVRAYQPVFDAVLASGQAAGPRVNESQVGEPAPATD